ncbi:winged helix-turn-helix transcriptional regulator [Curtobacterium sp. Csp1]|nr:ArsR family transcriptional regulator [Curtobacterium citreum]QKS16936.1 winged helix-turn-helix transcriptional regulator [Curtobacterium sp. Csp2]QKS22202.1 winged helix-turn-helix transcriptional regulator [Curtobacterium sp. Csp1]
MSADYCFRVTPRANLEPAAELFKVLSSASRLHLLCLLRDHPTTVGGLAEAAGLSQPLVSQHLRTLRAAGLVAVVRHGREAEYSLADAHVAHIVADAVTHTLEEHVPLS